MRRWLLEAIAVRSFSMKKTNSDLQCFCWQRDELEAKEI
jgi:hypothetical protein